MKLKDLVPAIKTNNEFILYSHASRVGKFIKGDKGLDNYMDYTVMLISVGDVIDSENNSDDNILMVNVMDIEETMVFIDERGE